MSLRKTTLVSDLMDSIQPYLFNVDCEAPISLSEE